MIINILHYYTTIYDNHFYTKKRYTSHFPMLLF
nr:MAG TPA: hypothetical protein [Caudoviricetes sp.]